MERRRVICFYETPAELVGKPKFALGDTAAYFIPKYYGAKDYKGAVIDKAKDRRCNWTSQRRLIH